MESIAAELGAREEELFGLMNTRNARGEYLFAGFQGKTQPFVREGDGSYSYQGDEGQRKLQVASSLDLAISDSGKKIFQNVTNAGRLELTPAIGPYVVGSTLSVSAPLVQDEVAFSGTPPFPPAGIGIRFISDSDYVVYDQASPPTFPVTLPDALVLQSGSVDDQSDTSDQLVFRGVSVQFDGVPVGGESIQITADPTRQKQGILDTIANLRTSLESPATGLQVRDAVAVALTNLDHGMSTVDGVRGEIGARLNIIDSTQTDNEDVALVNKSVQADLRELDYAEALSRLSFQSIVLEAAQQSYVKISSLNLFNQLR